MGLYSVADKEASGYIMAVDIGTSTRGSVNFTLSPDIRDKVPLGVPLEMRYFMAGSADLQGKSNTLSMFDDKPTYKIMLPYTYGHEPFGWQVPHVPCGENLQLSVVAPPDHNPNDIISLYSVDFNSYVAHIPVGDFKMRRKSLSLPWKSRLATPESQIFNKVQCGTVYQLRYFDINGIFKNASMPFRFLRDEIFTVMAPPVFKLGNDLTIEFECDMRAPISTWMGLAPAGSCSDIITCADKIVAWQYAPCKTLPAGSTNNATFAANWMLKKLTPGRYDAFYFVHGTVAAARDDFMVLPANAADYSLIVDRINFDLVWDRYMKGEHIWVYWKGPADHDPEDWIALYEEGLCEPAPGGAIQFDPCYKAKMLVGYAGQDNGKQLYNWDSGPIAETLKYKFTVGKKYFFRMYLKDSYTAIAESATFEVLEAVPPAPPVPYVPTKSVSLKGKASLSEGVTALWTSTKPHPETDWVGLYKTTECLRSPPGAYDLLCTTAPKLVGGLQKVVSKDSASGKVYWKPEELKGVAELGVKYNFRIFSPGKREGDQRCLRI
jgi:hypothetical protein